MTGLYRTLLATLRAGFCLGVAACCCNLYEGRTLELFPGVDGTSVECRSAADCPRDRAFCAGGGCRQCLIDTDCGRGKPACVGNACVECRSAGDCASNQSCNSVLSSCALTCGAPSDCAGQPASRCSSELDLCVQCLSDVDCTEPPKPACESGGRCVECRDDGHCPPERPSCNSATRECVECVDSSDCAGRVCDTREARCVDCLEDADCDGGTCERGRCRVPCAGAADCDPMRPVCDSASGLCVECSAGEDCGDPRRRACNLDRQCVECTSDADCNAPGKPACIIARQRCGECTRDEHCLETMHCDLPAARCAPLPGPGPGPSPGPDPMPDDSAP
jgi:hypothetical protein